MFMPQWGTVERQTEGAFDIALAGDKKKNPMKKKQKKKNILKCVDKLTMMAKWAGRKLLQYKQQRQL